MVKIGSGSFAASSGTLAYNSTTKFWNYTPAQAETIADFFIVEIYKADCLGAAQTIITSASNVSGYAGTDQSKITNATATVNLSNTTIKNVTDAVVLPSSATINITGNLSGSVGSVTGAVGSVTAAVTVGTINANVITASVFAVDAIDANALAQDAADKIAETVQDLQVLTRLDSMIESDGAGQFRYDTIALSMVAGGTDWTANERTAIRSILGVPTSGTTPTDPTVGILDTIRDKTTNLPSDPADASDIAASFSSLTGLVNTLTGYVDTEVAAIKAKTDNLPVDPADASDIAASFSTVNGTLATIAGYIDTEVAAIKAKTDNLPANPAAVTDIPTANQNRDAVWNAILSGATYNIPSSAGRRLRQVAASIIWSGTAQGAGTGNNQIQFDAGASATNGIYDPGLVFIEAGTGAGQCRLILQYNGTTKTATVDRDWRINPDNTSEFVLIGNPGRDSVNEGLAQAGTSTTITLNASASSVDDCYNGQIVFIRSGTGQDQLAVVTDYVGSTKVATIKTHTANGQWAAVPDTTSAYVMMPAHNDPAEDWDNIAAIKAKTDNLPSDPADQSLLAAAISSAVAPLALEATAQDILTEVTTLTNIGGSGARTVAITVRDSSANPIQNATVRISRTGEAYVLQTNASGLATFSLDDATWTVAITATNFSFSPVSLVVSGNVTQTYTMTAAGGGVTPSDPPFCTGYWVVYNVNGTVQAGAQVSLQASAPPVGSTGIVMEDAVRTGTADNNGVVQFSNLIKGATYIVYRTGSSRKFTVQVPTTAGNTAALGSIVG
jgi:hypothetical protein